MTTPQQSQPDNGGPAFPFSAHPEHGYGPAASVSDGMSLRDYFAAHAPEAPRWFEPDVPQRPADSVEAQKTWEREKQAQHLIQWAFFYADSMIRARHAQAAAPQEAEAATCGTCHDTGMIGGPSFYAPDEGGVLCPDCAPPPSAPTQAAAPGVQGWRPMAYLPAGVIVVGLRVDHADKPMPYTLGERWEKPGWLDGIALLDRSTGKWVVCIGWQPLSPSLPSQEGQHG